MSQIGWSHIERVLITMFSQYIHANKMILYFIILDGFGAFLHLHDFLHGDHAAQDLGFLLPFCYLLMTFFFLSHTITLLKSNLIFFVRSMMIMVYASIFVV
jgi:hypothetical protein